MAITADSVVQAIPAAFRRTTQTLFQPFDLGKWFGLGFCAWLANLAEGGGGGSGGGGPQFHVSHPLGTEGPDSDKEFSEAISHVQQWIAEHWVLLASVAVLVVFLILVLGLLLLWLSSRGKFMFLDGVVHNRGIVVQPWRRYRELANSLFGFRIVFGLVILLAVLSAGAACVALAWPDIEHGTFGAAALAAVVVGIISVMAIGLGSLIVSLLLEDFVIPVMYLRDQPVLAAWGVFRRELMAGHLGPILFFYLLKLGLLIAVAVISVVAMCLTCCVAALPYIGTVILLPLLVFMRCYSLCFIEQYGPEWEVFAYELLLPAPAGTPGQDVGEVNG